MIKEEHREYYYEHKREIIQEFRKSFFNVGEGHQLPENDEDLENWYLDELLEIAKDWYEQEVDEIETIGSNFKRL